VNDGRREPTRSDERRQTGDQPEGGPPCLGFPGAEVFARFARSALVVMRWNEKVGRTCTFAAFASGSKEVARHEHEEKVERIELERFGD